MTGITSEVRLLPDLDGAEFMEARVAEHRFPLHFHETFVIQHVVRGADWCCRNGLTAARNEVFVHMPHAPHTGGSVGSEQLRYRAIYPGIDVFQDLTGASISDLGSNGAMVVRDRPFVNRVETLLDDCANQAAGASSRSRMKVVFESLLDLSDSDSENRIATRPIFKKLRIAKDYLARNYALDVTTAELSSVCEVSEYHLIRSFKKHFGITPRQYLISRRVSEARKLLASGMSATAAAYECGFADQSHLNRYFKKVTGYTPGQLRG